MPHVPARSFHAAIHLRRHRRREAARRVTDKDSRDDSRLPCSGNIFNAKMPLAGPFPPPGGGRENGLFQPDMQSPHSGIMHIIYCNYL